MANYKEWKPTHEVMGGFNYLLQTGSRVIIHKELPRGLVIVIFKNGDYFTGLKSRLTEINPTLDTNLYK